eukprot:scaffold49329_cov35-Tisochrysis_lutea.AAC.3
MGSGMRMLAALVLRPQGSEEVATTVVGGYEEMWGVGCGVHVERACWPCGSCGCVAVWRSH